jgi:hypothetical protein
MSHLVTFAPRAAPDILTKVGPVAPSVPGRKLKKGSFISMKNGGVQPGIASQGNQPQLFQTAWRLSF